EKKQRAAAMKKLKSNRPMSDDDEDEDEVDDLDEEAAKELKNFIADAEEE
ncbi:unnamed protein product, partial [Rotaria magnacalcarata]